MWRLGITIRLSPGGDRFHHRGSAIGCDVADDGRVWGFKYVGEVGAAVAPIPLTTLYPAITQARLPGAAPSLRRCTCASGGALPVLRGNRRLIHRLEEYVASEGE